MSLIELLQSLEEQKDPSNPILPSAKAVQLCLWRQKKDTQTPWPGQMELLQREFGEIDTAYFIVTGRDNTIVENYS